MIYRLDFSVANHRKDEVVVEVSAVVTTMDVVMADAMIVGENHMP